MASAAVARSVGSIVNVRGRDWVVTSDDGEILALKPLSGGGEEATAVHLAIEGQHVRDAQFPAPSPTQSSDLISGTLLRDAARLALRSGAGPFRSLGRLSVRPRPYQFVPLIMALCLDPARLLIRRSWSETLWASSSTKRRTGALGLNAWRMHAVRFLMRLRMRTANSQEPTVFRAASLPKSSNGALMMELATCWTQCSAPLKQLGRSRWRNLVMEYRRVATPSRAGLLIHH